ncbi:unnamed protein product [Adineta ricciae]|uniref:ADP-ribosylglycohydrolase n=1 Tax=Adineta ricciae TaxID=249248 RepID=A0A814QU62_ADIRI|nr:unnamed protein product [Adineta ricciae]
MNWKKAIHRVTDKFKRDRSSREISKSKSSVIYYSDKSWLNLRFDDSSGIAITKPADLEDRMREPDGAIDEDLLKRVQGSMVGMALGDALGASVEFRPREYLENNPVRDLQSGGTWGLAKGQFTDDTSMALCLASSLVVKKGFNPYDQLVRYKWWYRYGYMSSTGECFDIGKATRDSLEMFEERQKIYADQSRQISRDVDSLSYPDQLQTFDVNCSCDGVAGNGALMRLAPVPLFFYQYPEYAVEYSGLSGQITHGDVKAYDACRYYGALIVAAIQGQKKDDILGDDFYSKNRSWFGKQELCSDIRKIAKGSFKKLDGYYGGIRGKGYIVDALEAALWAFWSDNNSFREGALNAVNLGDDTDTTAAIYGQLAGAYYGLKGLDKEWVRQVYARKFILNLSKWIAYEGTLWQPREYLSSQFPSGITTNEILAGGLIPIDANKSVINELTQTLSQRSSNNLVESSYEIDQHQSGAALNGVLSNRTHSNADVPVVDHEISNKRQLRSRKSRGEERSNLSTTHKTLTNCPSDEYRAPLVESTNQNLFHQAYNTETMAYSTLTVEPPVVRRHTKRTVATDYRAGTDSIPVPSTEPEKTHHSKRNNRSASSSNSKRQSGDHTDTIIRNPSYEINNNEHTRGHRRSDRHANNHDSHKNRISLSDSTQIVPHDGEQSRRTRTPRSSNTTRMPRNYDGSTQM